MGRALSAISVLCVLCLVSGSLLMAQETTSTNDILYIERFLDLLGHSPGSVDGLVDQETRDAYAAVKRETPWLLDDMETSAEVMADLFVLTIPIGYHGPAKAGGAQCGGALSITDGAPLIDMNDCPASHVFWIRQYLARAIQATPIKYILYSGMKGVGGSFRQTFRFTVKTEDGLMALREKRQFSRE